MTGSLVKTIGLALLLVILRPGIAQNQGQAQFDKQGLDAVEDLSESLANDLLEMSIAVRDKDLESIGKFIANPIVARPLPGEPDSLVHELKWIYTHGWKQRHRTLESLSRTEFLRGWEEFLHHFSEIEDVRFKVKQATFNESQQTEGSARVAFYLIGRDHEGRREWVTAWADIYASKKGNNPWRISRFDLNSLESRIALKDLFSEVSVPAGVSAVFPTFGVEPNDGFMYHGGATADVNGDGLLDVATTGVDQNYLYLNEGNGRFRDISAESLVKYAPRGSGPLFLDYDNDGDVDLFLAAVGSQVLLENRLIPDGELRFWDVSGPAKVAVRAVGFSAVAADVDGNGFPDIYVASYNRYGMVMPNAWHQATNGTRNLLFINQGDGTFREAAADWSVDDGRWSYAAAFADIDGDGDQDLYVANDFGENGFYLNQGGRFTDAAALKGLEDPGFGMGVSFGDYNNDGNLDLHITNMSSTAGNRILRRLFPEEQTDGLLLKKLAVGNSLYKNNGDGTFDDVTAQVGSLQGGWAFGGGFVDFDNDGWEDLYTPNGFISGKSMKDT